MDLKDGEWRQKLAAREGMFGKTIEKKDPETTMNTWWM